MTEETAAVPVETTTAVRENDTGRFVKGHSGNPAGRPKSKDITELKQDLDLTIRQELAKPERVKRVIKIIDKMMDLAENGDKKAAKLILDKTVSNVESGATDEVPQGRQVVFVIRNATIEQAPAPVDATFTEVQKP